MRHLYKLSVSRQIQLSLLALVLIIAGCAMQEKTGFNRVMQNVTAKYNILFNAREILAQKQEAYELSYIDAYDNILSVYQDTIAHNGAADKELDAVLTRANTIISEKEQSKYIPHANLLLGQASHLYGRYFNSVEYFKYVTLAFKSKKEKDVVQEARVWMARSLLYLNQIPQAKTAIDSAMANINPKKKITADVYATATQFFINTQEYAQAETTCKLVVQYANTKRQKLRWTFILAQLQELNKNTQDAYLNYTKVVKSNASFEMAFNADLNRIRIEDKQAGRNLTRMQRLQRLLRDDKNADLIDQIYYQMALANLADNDINSAIKNLQLSIRNSTVNQNQKGLSYLRLAEISFKNKSDYVKAKMYYDSTLVSLSHNYPEYDLIKKKSENLQVLADRLSIIGREDTLQSLVKLTDTTARNTRMDEFTKAYANEMKQANLAAATSANNAAAAQGRTTTQGAASTVKSNFYFDNAQSVSQGIGDFRRIWGPRKLEDNWRRSTRAGGGIANNTPIGPNTAPQSAPPGSSAEDIAANNYRQKLVADLPLTAQSLELSNVKVYNAYTDIANFYRDVLGDKKEAIAAYESLLTRYPNDPNKAAIYYNLYRLYSDIDPAKSERYKNLLLNTFPTSLYAKVILDPDYNKKLEDKDAELNALYNQVYDKFTQRKYQEVIASSDSLLKAYPDNKLSTQLLYLRAIANGHQVKYDPFRADLLAISVKYPDDQLITPLIGQHIVYLDANQDKMRLQEFALIDSDPTSQQFLPAAVPQQVIAQQAPATVPVQKPVVTQPVAQPAVKDPQQNAAAKPPVKTPVAKPDTTQKVSVNKPEVKPPVTKPDTIPQNAMVKPPVTKPDTLQQAAVTKPPVVKPDTIPQNAVVKPITPPVVTNNQPVVSAPVVAKPVVPSIYSLKDSTNYYFVINVASGNTNLASSRFGVGQFNRANYTNVDISHQLKDAGADNQLIYVGRFNSLKAVKDYARAIVPRMGDIMKVPANKYSFFIITKENLDKLADKKTLDLYIEFYQNNY